MILCQGSSPHTRGCFPRLLLWLPLWRVFPAYAGVFLLRDNLLQSDLGLPRIRGGVSSNFPVSCGIRKSSPHTRGCFSHMALPAHSSEVFPAYAGVFLDLTIGTQVDNSLPRIRGGVSHYYLDPFSFRGSSPHTRGCFRRSVQAGHGERVFPAYAGVFLHLHQKQ